MRGAVVGLGNFDGVHLGHQAILRECVQAAKRLKVVPAVMTFFPHPREFFAREARPLRLQSFRQKMEAFEEAGIEAAFVVRFNTRFASLTAEEFVAQVLGREVGALHVVTGYNFAFGKGRGGDTAYLAQAAGAQGIGFTSCSPVMSAEGVVVSSSGIRALLAEGKVKPAEALLGRGYSIEGRVIHGDKRGRDIGYPTANIAMGELFRPRYGVYAVRMMVGGEVFAGMANLGVRPMFEVKEPLLEVHAFDMREDLYGKRVRVELVDFIREEAYFDSLDALKSRIAKDEAVARAMLLACEDGV